MRTSKKILAVCILVFLCLSCVGAWQDAYNAQSREFRMMQAVFRLAGRAVPSPTAPITGSQMEGYLLKLGDWDGSLGLQCEQLIGSLGIGSRTFSFEPDVFAVVRPTINPQVFVHSNEDASVVDWEYPYRDWLPCLDFEVGLCLGNVFYGFIDLNLTTRFSKIDYGTFFSNILWDIMDFELALPRRAYASIGTNGLNLLVGRDKVSAGNGITGNLVVGDGHWWNDFAKLSVLLIRFHNDVV